MIEKPILLDLPMPILTPRLKIVPMHIDYADQLHQAIEESRETLIPWMTWADKPTTLEERREFAVQKYTKFLLREDIMLIALTPTVNSYWRRVFMKLTGKCGPLKSVIGVVHPLWVRVM